MVVASSGQLSIVAYYRGAQSIVICLAGEIETAGKGPLGQIGVPLTPKGEQFAGVALALWIGVFLVAAIGFNKYGQQEGNEEIY